MLGKIYHNYKGIIMGDRSFLGRARSLFLTRPGVFVLTLAGLLYTSTSSAYPLYYIDPSSDQPVLVTDGKVPKGFRWVYAKVGFSDFPAPRTVINAPPPSGCLVIQEGEIYEIQVIGPMGPFPATYVTGALLDENGEDCKPLDRLVYYHLGIYGGLGVFHIDDEQVYLGAGMNVNCDTPTGVYTLIYNGKRTSFELVSSAQPQLRPLGATTPQPPSIFTSSTKKESTRDYEVWVTDQCGFGRPVPNANVSLTHTVVEGSGGHVHHDANRDDNKGFFSSTSFNTGATGKTIIKYTAPQVSGKTKVTLKCTLPDGSTCVQHDEHIDVGSSGLLPLGAGANYVLVGGTGAHPDNHYGVPALNQALVKLADDYAVAYPGSKLIYNDMSLKQGGLFDCMDRCGGVSWHSPHKGHRAGRDADISYRDFPAERRTVVKRWIREKGQLKIHEEGNHWHVSLR